MKQPQDQREIEFILAHTMSMVVIMRWYVFDLSGLSAPVPRGRKGRRGGKKVEVPSRKSMFSADLSKVDINPNMILADIGYRKHLERHAIK